jgi:hypothetical protein
MGVIYEVKGSSNDFTSCELCGRTELKGTVVLQPLDEDGNPSGDACYFGTSCAATAAGWTQREVTTRVKAAQTAERERENTERAARWQEQREFCAAWYLQHYGTANLIAAAVIADTDTVDLSAQALRAHRESLTTH